MLGNIAGWGAGVLWGLFYIPRLGMSGTVCGISKSGMQRSKSYFVFSLEGLGAPWSTFYRLPWSTWVSTPSTRTGSVARAYIWVVEMVAVAIHLSFIRVEILGLKTDLPVYRTGFAKTHTMWSILSLRSFQYFLYRCIAYVTPCQLLAELWFF